MMKKLKNRILLVVMALNLLIFGVNTYCEEKENDYQVKRFVSFVCDDSYSMLENGQDYYYANYTLQNLIGMMNESDELNVVYLSNEEKNNTYNMSNVEQRREYIDELKHYNNYSDNTDFAAIETAAEYLKSKKELFGNNNKYYLIVITDGNFSNYPANFTKYLNNLRDYFVDSYFKGIFIAVGDKVSSNLENSVKAANQDDYHYISSNGKEDIVKAVFEAHDLIYRRDNINEKELRYSNGNSTISFDAKQNVNRVIVLEQNQNAKVKSIEASNGSMDDYVYFEGEKAKEPRINSVIVHSKNDGSPLEKGNININFDKPVNISKDNLKVIVEYTGAEADDKRVMPTTKPPETTPSKDIVDSEASSNTNEDNNIENNSNRNNERNNTNNNTSNNNTTNNNNSNDNNASNNTNSKNNIGGGNNGGGGNSGGGGVHHTVSDTCHCPCPIFQLALLFLLIYLLKKLYDRHKINNAIRNSDSAHSSRQIEDLNYELAYTNKKIKITTILILIDLLLLLLCKLFLCRCEGICLCILNYLPGGCGRRILVNWGLVHDMGPIDVTVPSLPGPGPVPPIDIEPIPMPTPGPGPTPAPAPTPTPPTHPIPLPEYMFPVIPFVLLAILGGYLFKNKFDTRFHGVEKWSGKKRIDDNNVIKVNGASRLIPYAPQSGSGCDLPIKAANKTDRVIVPKKFLTSDMKLEGEAVNVNRDLILYENMKLTKLVDGKEVAYIYKYYPNVEVDT